MKRWFWIVSGITCVARLDGHGGRRHAGAAERHARFRRLIGLRDGVFEFEEDRGNRRRVIRVEQVEVRTVELDEDGPGAVRATTTRGRPAARAARARGDGVGAPAVDRHRHLHPQRPDGVLRGQRPHPLGPRVVRTVPKARTTRRAIPTGRFRRGRPRALIGRVGDEAPFFIGTDTAGHPRARVRSALSRRQRRDLRGQQRLVPRDCVLLTVARAGL